MSIELALADAATNCIKQQATAVVTLRSGVQYAGKLHHRSGADQGTRHMTVPSTAVLGADGWVTFDVAEVAAVESRA